MTYQEIAYPAEKTAFYTLLLEQLQAYTAAAPTPVAALANSAAVLGAALSDINWAGFYLVRGESLVLGPFQGKPAVMVIPDGQGVCGAAWREKKAQVVDDVHRFAGHIACDCLSRSEIAVPVFAPDGAVRAILDIDSPLPGRFDADDAAGLQKVAALIAPFVRET
jgi:GAF domain-containing protein